MATVPPTDEIYERYLQEGDRRDQRARRRARAGRRRAARAGARLRAIRSADVFLLKYAPQPAEIQEGVAFYGRAGQAVLKSLQRLHVDPLAVYGTNCLKFGTRGRRARRAPWLARELHIVQPKLVVVMGADALAFLNALEFPLARPLERDRRASCSSFTPTIEALVVPRHRRLARRATGEDRLLERLQAARPLVGRASALLSRALGGARRARRRSSRTTCVVDRLWERVALVGHRLARPRAACRRCFSLVWLVLPAWRGARGCSCVALALVAVAASASSPELHILGNFAKLGAIDLRRVLVPRLLRDARRGSCSSRRSSRSSTPTRSGAGPTKEITTNHAGTFYDALLRVPGARRARRGEPRAARPALLRALPRRRRPLRPAAVLDVARRRRLVRRDDGARGRPRGRRAAGAAAALGRVPARERRPDLAAAPAPRA